MTTTVKHSFVSPKADGGDSTLVKPSDWNDEHNLITDSIGGFFLGRVMGTAGGIQELAQIRVAATGTEVLIVATGSLHLPVGTSAQRPSPPVNGSMRYNTDTGSIEMYQSGGWQVMGIGLVGEIRLIAVSLVPTGWYPCNGTAINRAGNPALSAAFAAMTPPYPYGAGNGTTTFNVPDLRDRVPGGVGSVLTPIGAVVGNSSIALNASQLPAHSHDALNAGSGGNFLTTDPLGSPTTFNGGPGPGTLRAQSTTQTVGSGVAFSVMQPTMALTYVIKGG
jgi:microcystin-dependent protein